MTARWRTAATSPWRIDERAVNPVAALAWLHLIELGRKWRSCLSYPAIMMTHMSHQVGTAPSLDKIGQRAPVKGRRSINFLFAHPQQQLMLLTCLWKRCCFPLFLFSSFLWVTSTYLNVRVSGCARVCISVSSAVLHWLDKRPANVNCALAPSASQGCINFTRPSKGSGDVMDGWKVTQKDGETDWQLDQDITLRPSIHPSLCPSISASMAKLAALWGGTDTSEHWDWCKQEEEPLSGWLVNWPSD